MNKKHLLPMLVAALATPLIVAGCGGGDVDTSKAEKEIKNGISSKTGSDVQYVKCPDSVNAKKGGQFHCTALVPVTVTQENDNGRIRWQIASLSGNPLAAGATGASGPSGASGASGSASASTPSPASPPSSTTAGGGNYGRFVTFTNSALGYSIRHPSLWKKVGSGGDVNFMGPDRFVHVVVVNAPILTPKQERADLGKDPRLISVKKAEYTTLGGKRAVHVVFEIKVGKSTQVIQRFQLARGKKLASIAFGATPAVSAQPGYTNRVNRIVNTFHWL